MDFEYYLAAAVGLINTWVTERIKKWFGVNNPMLKLSMVVVISAIAAVGLGWIFQPEFIVRELLKLGAVAALCSIFGNAVRKTQKG